MSFTITLTGRESILSANHFPPLHLDDEWEMALLSFETFHSIPNVDEYNNTLQYIRDDVHKKSIIIPTGTYELSDINDYVKSNLPEDVMFELTANKNTLKSELISSEIISFNCNNSIGPLLGFGRDTLENKNQKYISSEIVDIFSVNAILVDCNIVTGAYTNGKLVHTLHEFFPQVAPGYKIVEVPNNLIYMPVTTKTVDNITLQVTDQNGRLINFRKEEITVRLHLKKKK